MSGLAGCCNPQLLMSLVKPQGNDVFVVGAQNSMPNCVTCFLRGHSCGHGSPKKGAKSFQSLKEGPEFDNPAKSRTRILHCRILHLRLDT